VPMPLHESNGFLPDYPAFKKIASGIRLMYLNYPNNPTGAAAPRRFFEETVRFAARRGIAVCHDNAYSELYYDDRKPGSFLQADGARSVGVEFHSLSKTFNMTGWRIGFVAGNTQMIAALAKIKSNIDSGVFSAIQMAGVEALSRTEEFSAKLNGVYQKRRDLLMRGLEAMGWPVFRPHGAFYLWTRMPGGQRDSMEFCRKLLEETGIVITPGVGFGKMGEGFVRFALTVPAPGIREALERMSRAVSRIRS
ncbi:MAG: aminotransferase class I/II-fold pyridoxal phosphate-dependent enzyme, partial [Candidatus Omnitrophica bacterium]|nr:aminotransferase class I/II-fold pyridoxal phosphate-dependent enzyme [Candidatus Omnitrophota bacterium]